MAAPASTPIWKSEAWAACAAAAEEMKREHLRTLITDAARCSGLVVEVDGIVADYSRQKVNASVMSKLLNLASAAGLSDKMAAMARGDHINVTEDRAVMHIALRAAKEDKYVVDGVDVVPEVHAVLDRIKSFSEDVRAGKLVGATGKTLTNVVSIGIGGSYLGVEFVYEALRKEHTAAAASEGRKLHFLANVDPVDVARALEDFDPETTLVVIISKTFTTAETMLNARTLRSWLVSSLAGKATPEAIVAHHMAAVSTNLSATSAFGINPANVFGFWDWVGGRYSVCSAVGMLPLSLQFGFTVMNHFLEGARAMDKHFLHTPASHNLPVILGLLGVWNSTFLGHPARALLPYSQALTRFAAHIQQVDMESNGKRVTTSGETLPFEAGEIDFGEPGTNGQHSFYQLLHQGRVVPCDFIGFCESQNPIELPGEPVSNHDELMSNFFAQPDALACGVDDARPHKVFPGDRPSTSILLPRLNAYTTGQLLSVYEHRTAVQGFIWGVPSFDQWGVELGKVLAKQVRGELERVRKAGKEGGETSVSADAFNPATTSLLSRYLKHVDSRY